MSVITVTDLKKSYGALRAVDGISFAVEAGEIFGILGPNGAGKTTTLEIVEGLRKPDGGEVTIDGLSVWPQPGPIKKLIGIQLQSTSLFDYLTVREMISLFASFYKLRLAKARLDNLLDIVGLVDKAGASVRQLSGGQQQRLSISLALVNDPKIVFLDEPTTGLDPQARRHIWEVVRDISSRGKTVVLTTHYMEEAEVLCGRVAVMDQGKIMKLDSPANLIRALGAKAKITFSSKPSLPKEKFQEVAGALEVTEVDDSYKVYTSEIQPCLLGLLQKAADNGSIVENLTVSGANLEDVFLNLTGRGLRD